MLDKTVTWNGRAVFKIEDRVQYQMQVARNFWTFLRFGTLFPCVLSISCEHVFSKESLYGKGVPNT